MKRRRRDTLKSAGGPARLARRETATLRVAASLGDCPRPDKRRYPNKKEAKASIRRSRLELRDTLHAYRCVCGGFHVGHRRRPAVELELAAEVAA